LFGEQGEEACVRNIRVMVKKIPDPTPIIKTLCTRLEQCRDQDNNPEELVDEDDLLLEDHIPSKQARLDRDSGDSSGV
jgi:hypothetical protein